MNALEKIKSNRIKLLLVLALLTLAVGLGVLALYKSSKSYVVIRNQTENEISSVERIIVQGSAGSQRQSSTKIGNIPPGSEIKESFSTGDGTLRIAFVEAGKRVEVDCGYVTNMLTGYTLVISATEPHHCVFDRKP